MKHRKRRLAVIAAVLTAAVAMVVGGYEVFRTWGTTAALKQLGPADAVQVPRLLAHLDDYNAMIREAAARALGQIGPAAKGATPELIRTLHDSYAPARSHAAWALGQIEAGAPAIPPLIDALDDEDAEVRRYAAFALRQRAALAEAAVPKLIERLDDPHLAYLAAEALGAIGPAAKESIPHIVRALRADKTLARMSFASALGKFGNDAKEAVPDLLALAQDPDAEVRKTASDALRNIDPNAAARPAAPDR